ncbi:MAG: TIGR03089 family protein [Marmoricola sp.]
MTSPTQTTDTVPGLLRALADREPGRPLVTAYDEQRGERTELSVVTYANWVAKVANLLVEEYLLDPGDIVRLALPPHWLSTVFLGAAWSAGLVVTTHADVPAALVVGGPDLDPGTVDAPALACALLPFAVRFPDGPPAGTDDFGTLWPGQPDIFVPAEPPVAGTPAWADSEAVVEQGVLIARARDVAAAREGARLLTDVDPVADRATTTLLPALLGGSLVLVTGTADERWPTRHEDERATDVLRSLPA